MKIRKIISAALICAVLGGALPCADISAAETDPNELYLNELCNFMKSENCNRFSAFSVRDVSGDGIPELIISEDFCHMSGCLIYTTSGKELLNLGKYGYYGDMGYDADKNIIWFYNESQGYQFDGFYRLENNEITPIAVFSNNHGAAASESELYYKFNDEEISADKYQAALDEYLSGCENASHDYAFTVGDIFECFSDESCVFHMKMLIRTVQCVPFALNKQISQGGQ